MTKRIYTRVGSFGTPLYSAAAVTTANIKTGSGTIIRLIVSEKAAGAIIFYDAITGTSPVIATIDTTNTETTYELGINFSTGLRWVKTGTAKITVVYI